MRDADIFIALSGVYLAEYFRRKQASDISSQSGGTERAAHLTAYLSRDADSVSVFIFHQNALGVFVTSEAEKVFYRSVLCGYLLAFDSAFFERQFFFQLLAQR